MKLKKCKSCKTDIDAKATKCPHCQADQRGWFRRHPILTGLLGLIVLGMVIGAAGGGNKTNTSSNTPTTSQTVVNPTAIPVAEKITARELADDFDSNQVAAEAKWNGKLVEFNSTVTNITEQGLTFSNVATKQYSLSSITCSIKDKNQVMSLANGQSVTVRGKVDGQTFGVISVKNCEVVK